MSNWYEDVSDFHYKFGHPSGGPPKIFISEEGREIRKRLIREEYKELIRSLTENHQDHKVAHEAVDLMYVCMGTCVAYGVDPKKIWNVIHKANMSKKSNGLDKPTKPDGWLPADSRRQVISQGLWFFRFTTGRFGFRIEKREKSIKLIIGPFRLEIFV